MSSIRVTVSDDFDENAIAVGDILKYVNDDIQHPTEYEHPHVVVGIDGHYIYTVCGTSQQDSIENKLSDGAHTHDLFPAISPKTTNGLDKTTFFDCTAIYDIHRHYLQDKFQKGEVVLNCGKACYGDYDQIRNAIKSCDTSDINDLLVHPEDEF